MIYVIPEWSSGFPHFIQFNTEELGIIPIPNRNRHQSETYGLAEKSIGQFYMDHKAQGPTGYQTIRTMVQVAWD